MAVLKTQPPRSRLAPLLIATDLDGTLLANGSAPESPGARALFDRVAGMPEVILVFVSGRRKELQMEAMREFHLPTPDHAIADVGASVYSIAGGRWQADASWESVLQREWQGLGAADLMPKLVDIRELRPQEPEAQARLKLSFYADAKADPRSLQQQVAEKLSPLGVSVVSIWSVDEKQNIGLLDVLPRSATKLGALRHLARSLNIATERILACGDSGNDLAMLTSGLPAVAVANATDELRRELDQPEHRSDRLHRAAGGFLGFNGNYAAGILEGIARFFPDYRPRLEELHRETSGPTISPT